MIAQGTARTGHPAMIRGLLLVAGVVSIGACDDGNAPSSGTSRTSAVAQDTRWAERCPLPSDAPRAPIGRTAAALAAQYGPAARDERFVLGEATDRVRQSVRNVLPSPADLTRGIREMTWQSDGCELTIWLVRQGATDVAIQTMRAPTGGES